MAQYDYNPLFYEFKVSDYQPLILTKKELYDAFNKNVENYENLYSSIMALGDLDIRDYMKDYDNAMNNASMYIKDHTFNAEGMRLSADTLRRLWNDRGLKAAKAIESYLEYLKEAKKDPDNIYNYFSMKDFLDNPSFAAKIVNGKLILNEALKMLSSMKKPSEMKFLRTLNGYDFYRNTTGFSELEKQDFVNKYLEYLKNPDLFSSNDEYFNSVKDIFDNLRTRYGYDDFSPEEQEKFLSYMNNGLGALTLESKEEMVRNVSLDDAIKRETLRKMRLEINGGNENDGNGGRGRDNEKDKTPTINGVQWKPKYQLNFNGGQFNYLVFDTDSSGINKINWLKTLEKLNSKASMDRLNKAFCKTLPSDNGSIYICLKRDEEVKDVLGITGKELEKFKNDLLRLSTVPGGYNGKAFIKLGTNCPPNTYLPEAINYSFENFNEDSMGIQAVYSTSNAVSKDIFERFTNQAHGNIKIDGKTPDAKEIDELLKGMGNLAEMIFYVTQKKHNGGVYFGVTLDGEYHTVSVPTEFDGMAKKMFDKMLPGKCLYYAPPDDGQDVNVPANWLHECTVDELIRRCNDPNLADYREKNDALRAAFDTNDPRYIAGVLSAIGQQFFIKMTNISKFWGTRNVSTTSNSNAATNYLYGD